MVKSNKLFLVTFKFISHTQLFIIAGRSPMEAYNCAYKQAQKEVGAIYKVVSIRASCVI